MELAQHHERRVVSERAVRSGGEQPALIAIPEHEVAEREAAPVAPPRKRALADSGTAARDTGDRRLRETVGETEMLAARLQSMCVLPVDNLQRGPRAQPLG